MESVLLLANFYVAGILRPFLYYCDAIHHPKFVKLFLPSRVCRGKKPDTKIGQMRRHNAPFANNESQILPPRPSH